MLQLPAASFQLPASSYEPELHEPRATSFGFRSVVLETRVLTLGGWWLEAGSWQLEALMSRLSQLENETFDVAIIGGGIIGCGIARDAALRGLRVALFERRDFGSGTTSASTRIIHGGLRYLEMLDLRLVRLDLRERETLLRIAPHLVKPLEFLIPFFDGSRISPLKLRLGLALYDALSYDKSLPSRRWLPAETARQVDAALNRPDVRGAAAYYDARVDSPERLALENVLDATAQHALAFNYCEVVAATPRLRVRDTLDGSEANVDARVLVNATGAWLEPTTESAHRTAAGPYSYHQGHPHRRPAAHVVGAGAVLACR